MCSTSWTFWGFSGISGQPALMEKLMLFVAVVERCTCVQGIVL